MIQRTVIGVLASVAALLSGSIRGGAQTVERDPMTGEYRVTYTALDGNEYTVVVRAHDKVVPVVSISIQRTNDVFVYRYTLKHLDTPMAEQAINFFDVPCAPTDTALALRPPPAWRAWKRKGERGYLRCSFHTAELPLSPGQEVTGLEVRSGWLPAISVARVQGLAGFAGFESGEDTPREVADLVNDLLLPTESGNWRGVLTLVPAWGTAVSWIALVLGDLDGACKLGWIDDAGVCGNLRTKLEQARAAAKSESTREHLQRFLAQLEAEHGSEPGKHVDDNAYWLLKTNVEYALRGSPRSSVGGILHRVDEACELRWIYDADLCGSLGTKLEQARGALEADDVESARQRLQSFLAEVEAEHGSGLGKHLNDNAYWLLKTSTEYILSRL